MLFGCTKCEDWESLSHKCADHFPLYLQCKIIWGNLPPWAYDSNGVPLNILSLTVNKMKLQLSKWKAVSVLMEQCCMTLVWMSVWKPVVSFTASVGCMLISSLLFTSPACNIDLMGCSTHSTCSREVYSCKSGNGNLYIFTGCVGVDKIPREVCCHMLLYFKWRLRVGRGEWSPLVQSCFVVSQLFVPVFTSVPFNW